MANEKHIEILKSGVEAWNNWRARNPEIIPDLTEIDLSEQDFSKANFNKVQFNGANLSGTILRDTDLSEANLSIVRFDRIYSKYYSAQESIQRIENFKSRSDYEYWMDVQDSVYGIAMQIEYNHSLPYREKEELKSALLSSKSAQLVGSVSSKTMLVNSCLVGANLRGANLFGADLKGANLSSSNLSEAHAICADFEGANFTGACIANWNINSETNLSSVICEYIYLLEGKKERRPLSGQFRLGEFTIMFQRALSTIDLIFANGIDWKAFFIAFQELQTEYQDTDLAVQAIERKSDQAFIIRLEVSTEIDKASIESRIEELYEDKIQILETQYEQKLKLQSTHLEDARRAIDAERHEKAKLIGVISTMASNQQGPTYNLQGSKFGGGFAAEGGYQEGGQFNDYSIQVGANMDDITKLIQSLKTTIQTFPKEQQADIDIEIEELQADLADEQKRDPKRLGKRVRSLWLASCAIAVGVAGVADFSNNVLELSEKLNVPIPIELIQQNPHIFPGG